MADEARTARGTRWKRRVAAVLIGGLVAFACGEGALRWLLFSDSPKALRFGKGLRHMDFYCERLDQDWWKLQSLLNRDQVTQPPSPDPLLGWTGPVPPLTYEMPDEGEIGDRTPVLLYGDSNAQCMTSPRECFQGLMASSPLSDRYYLLNYGVGGYGLDQIQRLLSASIDRFAGRDPIVVVSLLVDDNLERSMLAFRGWPKPRYRLEDGELVDPGPVQSDPMKFLAQNPPSIKSYLWRLVRKSWRPMQYDHPFTEEEIEERRALNLAILERIRRDLDARSLRWFLLLFQMNGKCHVARWSQPVVDEFIEAHDVPFVPLVEFFREVTGDPDTPGFLVGAPNSFLHGHLNAGGNKLVFEALCQGIEGRFGNFDMQRVRDLAAVGTFLPDSGEGEPLDVLGLVAHFSSLTRAPAIRYRAPAPDGPPPRLAMRAGDDGTSRIRFDLAGRRGLSAQARAVSVGGTCRGSILRFAWRTDDAAWTTEDLALDASTRAWTCNVAGASTLDLRIEYTGGDPACAWLVLDDLRVD